MFVTLDKFVVTDEAVNGNKERAEKVENKILHGVAQSVMAAERDIIRRIDRTMACSLCDAILLLLSQDKEQVARHTELRNSVESVEHTEQP